MSSDELSKPVKENGALGRDSVPEIVAALHNQSDASSRSWNIVEVLELLIDAGQFVVAEDLAERVFEMMRGDGRERLFGGYRTLCSLMIDGDQTRCIQELERLYLEIQHSGHSIPDRVRGGLLLARALALCVGVGSLAQGSLLRARQVLAVELERISTTSDTELQAQVALELSKTYLHAPSPDALAAYSILGPIKSSLVTKGVSASRAFDLTRVLYQAAKMLGTAVASPLSDAALREEGQTVGGIAAALAELAIARRAEEISVESIERALEVLANKEFLSGAFEASFLLGSDAVERGHNVIAERHFRSALELAQRGGFKHGELLARIGLFQSASIGDNREALRLRCEEIVKGLDSELALGSSGLNAAAAQQIVGDVSGGLRTAKQCEEFFEEQGLTGFQSQCLIIMGTCEAHLGRWNKAGQAWKKAVVLDERRHAFIQVCERRGLVVQALVMHDMTTLGNLRDETVKKAEKLLVEADAGIERCGDMPEAVQARARLQSVHAQLCVMSKQHVSALRHLSAARVLFESLGLEFDVAMVDAFTGLSMIEVGKTTSADVLEEAVLTLQRAHQFFSSPPYPPVRWKVLYYMAVAGVHVSNNAGDPIDKMKWRELAIGWMKSAERDIAMLQADLDPALYAATGTQAEFSPGLKPEALEGLKRALGLKERGREKREKAETEKTAMPSGGVVH